MIHSFLFASTPEIHFGPGKLTSLPSLVAKYGKRMLLITGRKSFLFSSSWPILQEAFAAKGIECLLYQVMKEPSPTVVDACVKEYAGQKIDVVVALGGGSVLDAGKAISAMLPLKEPVKYYLEVMGTKNHPGTKIPLIAVPTTAGTGSEATKNAVLSEIGEGGFKKSLRHQNFVPNIALVDPDLMSDCPKAITAYSGMDAFTQLLESFLSTTANPLTDALALEGLLHVSRSLLPAYQQGEHDIHARSGMALASLLSGITLANAGLGLVHGFAGAIGGFFDIPHGVICSSLMPACNVATVRKLRENQSNGSALLKYSEVGRLFSKHQGKSDNFYIDFLLELISEWKEEMQIPRLSASGVSSKHFERIASASDNKSNPVFFDKEEMLEILGNS